MYRSLDILGLALCILCALALGFFVGQIVDWRAWRQPNDITVVDDQRESMPVVTLHGIRNGGFEGVVQGPVRLFLRNELVPTNASGTFRIVSPLVFTNEIDVTVPEGMRFVASKRGSKYYPVESSGGANIVPWNRVYFRTAEEAERAGYKR